MEICFNGRNDMDCYTSRVGAKIERGYSGPKAKKKLKISRANLYG